MDTSSEKILTDKGQLITVAFPNDLAFGSLRPIKRGGKSAYFCRECYRETQSIKASVIPIKTPHWTQSAYLDGIHESRQPTRICCNHALSWLADKIPETLLNELHLERTSLAEMLLSAQVRIRLDIESLRTLYEVALINQEIA